MPQKYLIKNISIVNEGKISFSDIYISGERIERIDNNFSVKGNVTEIDGTGKHLLPGCIDDQVHFREPGLTHKGTIYTESKAGVAGGVTSFMEMPNTVPNALTQELLNEKYIIGSQKSLANYSFFMGVSNDNYEEVMKINAHKNEVCGIKIFMGSSTGNMLVDNQDTLNKIFRDTELLIATHCEDENIIKRNYATVKNSKEKLNAFDHPIIRNTDACYASSSFAIELAKSYNTRLHILHISTAKELELFTNSIPLLEKRITAEVCVHHLHFTSDDYDRYSYLIKCNPAIKEGDNKLSLWKGLLDNKLDVIATDHAPHTLEEKEGPYEHAHSGIPLVQHSLLIMFEYYKRGEITLERIVEKMSHAVADCFRIKERGYIREGYFADLVMIDLNKSTKVTKESLLYKCNWSPFEGTTFPGKILKTFINGAIVYNNEENNIIWNESENGKRLIFNK